MLISNNKKHIISEDIMMSQNNTLISFLSWIGQKKDHFYQKKFQ